MRSLLCQEMLVGNMGLLQRRWDASSMGPKRIPENPMIGSFLGFCYKFDAATLGFRGYL